MPTVTVEGEKSFEVEAGKKLVLAHRGRRDRHHAQVRRQRPLHDLPGPGDLRRPRPDGRPGAAPPRARGEPRPRHPPLVPGPRRVRPDRQRPRPRLRVRRASPADDRPTDSTRPPDPARDADGRAHVDAVVTSGFPSTSCSGRCGGGPARRIACSGGSWPGASFFLRGRDGTAHLDFGCGALRADVVGGEGVQLKPIGTVTASGVWTIRRVGGRDSRVIGWLGSALLRNPIRSRRLSHRTGVAEYRKPLPPAARPCVGPTPGRRFRLVLDRTARSLRPTAGAMIHTTPIRPLRATPGSPQIRSSNRHRRRRAHTSDSGTRGRTTSRLRSLRRAKLRR